MSRPLPHSQAKNFADPGSLVNALVEDVVRWTANALQDDMAILAVTRRRV